MTARVEHPSLWLDRVERVLAPAEHQVRVGGSKMQLSVGIAAGGPDRSPAAQTLGRIGSRGWPARAPAAAGDVSLAIH
jgi:hypothetical protein